MIIFGHALLFLVSAAIIWFFAGILITSIDRVAKRFHQSGFTVAFFVLGFLTSISELSVMVNATVTGVPQISVGNLSGASFVILLGIVPLLAIVTKGIKLRHTLKARDLGLSLIVIALPTLFVLDGAVSVNEGIISLLAYGVMLYFIHTTTRKHGVHAILEEVEEELVNKQTSTLKDVVKIIFGALCIFVAGHFLVEEAVFFSTILHIPPSLVGLLLLSIGTNVPEIVIAVRSVIASRADIAFGDYLGSALTNTLIFGFLPIFNGRFVLADSSEFVITAVLMVFGFIAFYNLSLSGKQLSRREGRTLIFLYIVFFVIQVVNFFRFSA